MLTDEYVVQKFREGIFCSMMVLAEAGDKIGMTTEEAYRTASCFDVGMLTGGVCGAVTGAMIALGCKFGNSVPNDLKQRGIVVSKRDELVKRFREEHGGIDCPVLLGHDLRDPGQRLTAWASGAIEKKCPMFIRTAARIMTELLEEKG